MNKIEHDNYIDQSPSFLPLLTSTNVLPITLVSFSGEGQTVVWDEFKTLAVSLIPEYECMSWTAAITEELLTENVTLIDEFSNGCIPEKITVWAWERTKGTNEYTFNQGLITYRIYNINVSGNQMTWTEQSADEVVTVWSKIEE